MNNLLFKKGVRVLWVGLIDKPCSRANCGATKKVANGASSDHVWAWLDKEGAKRTGTNCGDKGAQGSKCEISNIVWTWTQRLDVGH